MNRVSTGSANTHWTRGEYAASAGTEVPGEGHVTTDKADGHEITVLRISLIGLADEEEQRHLMRVVGYEVEAQLEVLRQERRRCQRHVRRVAHQCSAEVRLRYIRICSTHIQYAQSIH